MELQEYAYGLVYVVLGVIVLLLSKIVKDVFTPYRIDEELTVKDNPAVGLVLAGYFAGVTIIFLGATLGPDSDIVGTPSEIATTVLVDFAYALGGVVALLLGRLILDKLVLVGFQTSKEIIQDRNVGTAAVECGCLIATAFTVAGAIHGEGGGPISAIIFFLLGQAVLVVFGWLYRTIVRYDLHAEIEADNVAAGVALGFNLVAMGIILLKGIAGDIVSWTDKLSWFAIDVAVGTVVLLVLRKVTDALFLPNTTIGHEIGNDKNMNAAWVEGVLATSAAAIFYFMV